MLAFAITPFFDALTAERQACGRYCFANSGVTSAFSSAGFVIHLPVGTPLPHHVCITGIPSSQMQAFFVVMVLCWQNDKVLQVAANRRRGTQHHPLSRTDGA
ncbi:hypothetical protein TcWFU_006989 [Taenia crassiceps]|uniref:Uncharacterized protein n=1 Tax=Taenia crassiceps TaxID=6207 RepID=A0ABR4Q5W8_9CEST